MKTEAADMRSSLRKEEIKLEKMQEQLSATEHSERMKDNRISDLLFRVQRLSTEVDSLKIDLVTRDTEVESLKVRINALRDERETLRNDLKLVNQRAKDAELRLAREENRTTRLEDRLNREISGSADKDTIIERRISEIGRLKDKLKTTTAEVREASRAAKPVMPMKPIVVSRLKNAVAGIEERQADAAAQSAVPELPAPIAAPTNRILSNEEVASLIDDVRSRTSVASDSLISMTDDSRDEAMRAEIADIAARMIAIVAQKEGMASPMRAMIAGKAAQSPHGRVALAERAANILRPEQPQP
jgi:chromosome segregation ATPase